MEMFTFYKLGMRKWYELKEVSAENSTLGGGRVYGDKVSFIKLVYRS